MSSFLPSHDISNGKDYREDGNALSDSSAYTSIDSNGKTCGKVMTVTKKKKTPSTFPMMTSPPIRCEKCDEPIEVSKVMVPTVDMTDQQRKCIQRNSPCFFAPCGHITCGRCLIKTSKNRAMIRCAICGRDGAFTTQQGLNGCRGNFYCFSGGVYREIVGGSLSEIPSEYKLSLSMIAKWFLENAVADEERMYSDEDDFSDYSDEDDIPTDNAYLLSLLASCYLSIDSNQHVANIRKCGGGDTSTSTRDEYDDTDDHSDNKENQAIFSAAKCLEKILYSTGEDGPDIRDTYELAKIYLRLSNPHPAIILLKTCLSTRNFRDFAKSPIKKSQMEKLLVEAKEAFNKQPPLRFEIGTEVECNLGERGFRPGIVIAHYYREMRFKPDFTACYQVRLTDEKMLKDMDMDHRPLIYAPVDSDYYIRLRRSQSQSQGKAGKGNSSTSTSTSTFKSNASDKDKRKESLDRSMQKLTLKPSTSDNTDMGTNSNSNSNSNGNNIHNLHNVHNGTISSDHTDTKSQHEVNSDSESGVSEDAGVGGYGSGLINGSGNMTSSVSGGTSDKKKKKKKKKNGKK